MVGGLVEEEQRRLGDERLREQHPAAPAARQRADAGVGVEAELRQHRLDPLFDAPAVAFLELVLQPAELGDRRRRRIVGDARGRLVVRADEIAQRAEPGRDGVEHRLVAPGVERVGVLRQARDAAARRAADDAGVGREIAGEHLEQRGLAFAVAAEHGDALARLNRQADVVEQREVAEGDADVIEDH